MARISTTSMRRLGGHLTTPPLAAFLWILLAGPGGDSFLADLGGAILICYGVWLLSGLWVALFSKPGRRPAWIYAAQGASLGALPFLLILPGTSLWDPSGALALGARFALIGAAAGLCYWFCAYWSPGRAGAADRPRTTSA